jgi:hypothetical protein
VPESAPAPNSFSGASGQAGLTWFQLGDLALRGRLPHLLQFFDRQLLDEGVLRVDHHGQRVEGDRQFDVLDAGGLAQASISFFRIGREASEMSVSPRQNFLKPPPVPEMPTVTLMAFFFAFWNSSATASVIG